MGRQTVVFDTEIIEHLQVISEPLPHTLATVRVADFCRGVLRARAEHP